MKSEAVTTLPLPPRGAPVSAARRVLIVDDDPAVLHLVAGLLGSDPTLFEPVGVDSGEAALRLLAGRERFDCLLADLLLPGMDGLQLVLAARELRPALKIVVMTSKPADDLHRAVIESGAAGLLAKPLDYEEVLASLAGDRPGALSQLEGDLDLLDICRLSAACRAEGGVRVRDGERQGILAHRGATLVHAAVDGLEGAPALAALEGWDRWRFESLSALTAARLPASCEMDMAARSPRRAGVKAGGTLRGLTLRHLIEWAMRGRETCTLTVTSRQRTGVLSFAAGRIRGAETADREGGRAAAEILDWENLSVRLTRSAEPAAAPAPAAVDAGLALLLARFCEEVDGLIATSVSRRRDGSPVGSHSADPALDAAAAAGGYARVIDSHLAAAAGLGAGTDWGETEDLLITTSRAYLLIRLLGDAHYHWLAVSSEANLALCRLLMRSHEPFLLSELADLGEIPDRGD